jgi:putative redox protein
MARLRYAAGMNTVTCDTNDAGAYPHTLHVRKHTFQADVVEASGGADSAPGPHDYFDASLASCTALTAMWYAKRHSIPLERIHTTVERDDAEERKGTYRLHLRVSFEGAITGEQRAALEKAVGACPVHKLMTTSDVVVDTTFGA